MNEIQYRKLSEEAIEPERAHKEDAGSDLFAAQDVIIAPGTKKKIPTDIAMMIPDGMEGHIRNRSGIFSKGDIITDGTVDAGYDGNVFITMKNIGIPGYHIRREDLMNEENKDIIPVTPNKVKWYLNSKGDKIEQPVALVDEEGRSREYDTFIENTYVIRKGEKIAQIVISLVSSLEWKETDEFSRSYARGSKGFGSSGYGEVK